MGKWYKTFNGRNLRMYQKIDLGRPLQPSLMFAGKAWSLAAHIRLGWKGLPRDKHSIMNIRKLRLKKVNNIGSWP